METIRSNIFRHAYSYILIIISMAGYVPKHSSLLRSIFFGGSLVLSLYLTFFQPGNSIFGIVYFILIEILYISFIMLVLARDGLRHWFIQKWGSAEEGYLAFEAITGFLFFHNAMSMGYVASSTENSILINIKSEIFFIIIAIIFFSGFIIKILAAKVVSIDIYYWKDMFMGKKICEFAVSGPYKYFNNPMYGIGQIQAYAAALWYGSGYGLAAAIVNQCLIFSFYYFFEKKFIKRVYLDNYLTD